MFCQLKNQISLLKQGMGDGTKMDEFSEKFQMTLIFGKSHFKLFTMATKPSKVAGIICK